MELPPTVFEKLQELHRRVDTTSQSLLSGAYAGGSNPRPRIAELLARYHADVLKAIETDGAEPTFQTKSGYK